MYVHMKVIQVNDTQGLWRKPKRKNMPPNRHQIDSKWVFKKKIDSQFMARLVAWWYNPIPVVDFI